MECIHSTELLLMIQIRIHCRALWEVKDINEIKDSDCNIWTDECQSIESMSSFPFPFLFTVLYSVCFHFIHLCLTFSFCVVHSWFVNCKSLFSLPFSMDTLIYSLKTWSFAYFVCNIVYQHWINWYSYFVIRWEIWTK